MKKSIAIKLAKEALAKRTCWACGKSLAHRRIGVVTCDSRCRQLRYRLRQKAQEAMAASGHKENQR